MHVKSNNNSKRGNIVAVARNRLEEVIPLDTPYSFSIDVCNLCNFKCKFCAAQSSKKTVNFQRQNMSLELFKKIVDDCRLFGEKIKVIRIGSIGEPLINRYLPEMISYLKESSVCNWIEIITNGSLLNSSLNKKLVDSGVDRIRISVEAIDSEGYEKMSGVKLEYSTFLANIEDLYNQSRGKTEIYIKTVDASVQSEEAKERFFNLFEKIGDRVFIDSIVPLWNDFAEINSDFHISDIGLHGQSVQTVSVCPYPFYSAFINVDGEVVACCADWKRQMVLGNASNTSLYDIWHGEKYRDFLISLAKGRKNITMCSKCDLPNYDCNDNIDNYAGLILERLENAKRDK